MALKKTMQPLAKLHSPLKKGREISLTVIFKVTFG